MKDTVIFDMDGTILNTLDDLHDAINYMLKMRNYKTRSLSEVRSFVGNGIGALVKRALPENTKSQEEFELCFNIFLDYYSKNSDNKTRPYDGIISILKELKPYKTAVVSNKYDAGVKALNASMFKGLLRVAIGERDGIPPKPHPQGVYDALELLDSSKQNAVYVGDSDVDFMTAKNSGLDFIAVSWGFKDREFLESLGCEYIVDSTEQLLQLIKSL